VEQPAFQKNSFRKNPAGTLFPLEVIGQQDRILEEACAVQHPGQDRNKAPAETPGPNDGLVFQSVSVNRWRSSHRDSCWRPGRCVRGGRRAPRSRPQYQHQLRAENRERLEIGEESDAAGSGQRNRSVFFARIMAARARKYASICTGCETACMQKFSHCLCR